MIDLDLYADALISGRVLGIGVGDDGARIERVLGSDFVEEANKEKWMRRDYGLIEFNFNRVDARWVCFGFSVQLHRLSVPDSELLVPAAIMDRFDGFRNAVKLDALADYMLTRGQAREFMCEKVVADFGYFSAADVKGTVVVSGEFNEMSNSHVLGDIWSIEIGSS